MATKTDMDRVALFKEMGYHTIGDNYVSRGKPDITGMAGRQILPGGSKERSGLSHGYFSEFQRIFEKEAASDPFKMRMEEKARANKKILSKTWTPAPAPKHPEGLGSFFGTFAGPIDSFSPTKRGQAGYKAPGKNMMTNPPKKGTGYGYLGVTLGKYPEFKSDKYEAVFDIVKKDQEVHKKKVEGKGSFKLSSHPQPYFNSNPYGGSKGQTGYRSAPGGDKKVEQPFKSTIFPNTGTINPFPTYSSTPYKIKEYKRPVHVVNSSGKTFVPNPGLKSAPQVSVINHSIQKYVTPLNYQQITCVTSY